MARNTANRLFTGLTFGQLCNCMVPEVVEAKTGGGAHDLIDIGLALLVVTGLSGFL
jgi:hypothetical protein